MLKQAKNEVYRLKTDGFHGELFCPMRDNYPGKALICFSGSDGRFKWTRMLAQVFQSHGLTTLALAYVMEEGLPKQFYHVPINPLEAAAMRLHDMGYEKVGKWGCGAFPRVRSWRWQRGASCRGWSMRWWRWPP